MSKQKRYFYSVVEEMIQNPDYFGYRGGRVEIFDRQSKSEYAIYEARFLIPCELFNAFREAFDSEESDLPVMIQWDIRDYGK